MRKVGKAAAAVNSYWGRAWIIQEVELAKRAFILVGNLLCSSDDLWRQYWYAGQNNALSSYTMRRAMLNHANVGAMPELLDLLIRFGLAGCTNKRDRVYSMLGLAKEGDRLEVNYQLQDARIAYDTLAACGSPYCICTVIHVTTRVFELHKTATEERYEEGPYIEFVVSAYRLNHDFYPGDCSFLAAIMERMEELKPPKIEQGWSSFLSTTG